ncbi:MAG: HupE/UreJ family protein [Rhodobacteraceae bacterium]|nr:HupE/UreJ family protein [Paracoccaceae bacterium]
MMLIGVGMPANQATGHALEPGYLELKALGGDRWRATWRKPAVGGQPMQIEAVLPQNCDVPRPPAPRFDGRGYSTTWLVICPDGLVGGQITIEGLERTRTDVLVRYELTQGEGQTMRLTASETSFELPKDPSLMMIVSSYVSLGIEHILSGIDHLTFVLALLLLIRNWRLLIAAITAFTVAHSLSLTAATLGWIILPPPPVEAVIALSILFLALELLRARAAAPTLTRRYPWAVAFAFGLLHGLGFAGALREIGLPQGDVPLALVSFNVGVEIGQLTFIAVVVAIALLLARLFPRLARRAMMPRGVAMMTAGYGIGAISVFWLVQRLILF